MSRQDSRKNRRPSQVRKKESCLCCGLRQLLKLRFEAWSFMTLIEILESREEALDVHEVAELLKVSERQIYELAASGKLPSFRSGKIIRFDPQDVADWLRQKKPSNGQSATRKLKEGRRREVR